jgi:hypothetical protein
MTPARNPDPQSVPAIRIVRGDPDAYELAALVGLVSALAARGPAGPQPGPGTAVRPSSWLTGRLSAPSGSWATRPHPAWGSSR